MFSTFILTEGAEAGPMHKVAWGPFNHARALGNSPDCLGWIANLAFDMALHFSYTFPGSLARGEGVGETSHGGCANVSSCSFLKEH